MSRTYSIVASIVAPLAILASFAGASGCSSSTKGGPGEVSSSSGGGSSGGGGEDSGAGCTAYTSTASLTSPTVSFKTDVLPLFQRSCGISGGTCHGMYQGGQQNLYLAEPSSNMDGDGDGGAILMGLVGVKSVEDPTMNLVTAGDLTTSFLMHKMDGDQCTLETSCEAADGAIITGTATVTTPCGSAMPYLNPLLAVSDRDTVRRWIAQGAMNN
jgi:hypothetical protein